MTRPAPSPYVTAAATLPLASAQAGVETKVQHTVPAPTPPAFARPVPAHAIHTNAIHTNPVQATGALASVPAAAMPMEPPAAKHCAPLPQGIPPHASAVVVVDLTAIRTNYRALRMIAGRAECAGIVKADAYGLGLEPTVTALLQEGCRVFFVANIDEAWRTRQLAPEAIIYVLNGLYPGAGPAFTDLQAQPVLGSREEIEDWSAFGSASGQRLPAAVHVDTGMNRLGLSIHDWHDLAQRQAFDAIDISLLMSHLACGDSPGSHVNASQRQAFDAARALVPTVPASLANSAATLLGPVFHYDMVRPGIAIYGGNALQGVANPMKPTVRVLARIIQVRHLGAGEAIGYGQTFRTTRPSRIAIISAGYADGVPRAVTDTPPLARSPATGFATHVGGYPAPVVGRVSMDLTAIDVTDVPEHAAARGQFAEVIGPHTRIDDVAAHAGTIGYEVLTRLSRRAHRVYLGGGG